MTRKPATAYIFSGIDGLDALSDRLKVLAIPAVRQRVQQAQDVLDRAAIDFDLGQFITTSDENYKQDLTLQALAVAVVQIGLFEQFVETSGKPEYLMGCSLGDIARTFCAGAVEFDVVVLGCWKYHLAASSIEGAAYHVKSLAGEATSHMIEEIEQHGIHLAVHQTPKHFIISGEVSKLEEWRQKEQTNERYQIRPLYNKPLHSPMMGSVTEHLSALYAHTLKPQQQWKYKLVSSTAPRVIQNQDDLLQDMTENFNSTVLWMQALQFAVSELGIEKFVNVGPAQTLILFGQRTPLSAEVTFVDQFSQWNQGTENQAMVNPVTAIRPGARPALTAAVAVAANG